MKLFDTIEQKGLKKSWVALKVGVSHGTLIRWDKGETKPRTGDLKVLSEILDMDVKEVKSILK